MCFVWIDLFAASPAAEADLLLPLTHAVSHTLPHFPLIVTCSGRAVISPSSPSLPSLVNCESTSRARRMGDVMNSGHYLTEQLNHRAVMLLII